MTPIEELLTKLLAIPSPTGQEKAVADFIIDRLAGFKIKKQFITPDRYNIIATKGSPRCWLLAHMDTVPGSIPVTMTEQDIYGRGACDNKQSVAGAIIASQQLTDIGLVFTVGEEQDFIGAKQAQTEIDHRHVVIVQEPTQFEVITGQWGVITCVITTTGTQQHSALPKTDSAIHKLVTILSDLQQKQWNRFNVGTINGGLAENIVAHAAQAYVVIRPETIQEYQAILETLKNIQAQVEIKNSYPPFDNKLGFPSKIGHGFAETAFFKNSLKFGAGNVAYAHSDHEHISRVELNQLPAALIKLVNQVVTAL